MDNQNQSDIDKIFDEEFNFTAINDGLGFHHSIKNKSEVQKSLKSKSNDLKKDFDSRIKKLSAQKTNQVDMGDLSPFYNKKETQEYSFGSQDSSSEILIDRDAVIIEKNANSFERFGAWIIDFIMVSVLFFTVFLSVILITNTPLSFVRDFILGKEFFITLMPMFAGLYIFYFSFFDKTAFSSPGKKIIGLQVTSINDESISMLQAMGRAAITLISFLTMGLLVLLDAQSRLTDTKVIRK